MKMKDVRVFRCSSVPKTRTVPEQETEQNPNTSAVVSVFGY
jgi:hypothetical protein